MITKFLNVFAFSPVYPVYQMCTLYIHLYNPINPSIFAGLYCRAHHFDMVFHSTEYTQIHWLQLLSAFKLWFDILTCLTKYFYSSAHMCGIIYMSPHTMITQLKTFHLKVVHNCYWYADYAHCLWINDALVTGHKTWLAYENYIYIYDLQLQVVYIYNQSWSTNLLIKRYIGI